MDTFLRSTVTWPRSQIPMKILSEIKNSNLTEVLKSISSRADELQNDEIKELADEIGILCLNFQIPLVNNDYNFQKEREYPKPIDRNQWNSANIEVVDEDRYLENPQNIYGSQRIENLQNINNVQQSQNPQNLQNLQDLRNLEDTPSITSRTITFILLVLSFLSYLILGTILFLKLEPEFKDKPFYKLFMLPLQTCLTIGWGNFPIKSPGAQLFCILYGVLGIPLCHTTLTKVGRSLYHSYVPDWILNSAALRQIPGKKEKIVTFPLFSAIKFLCFFHLVGFVLFNYLLDDFGIIESFYFDFFTSGFIGFGDIIPDPKNFLESFILFFYLPLGGIFQAVVNACLSYHFQRLFYSIFKNWLYRLHLKNTRS